MIIKKSKIFSLFFFLFLPTFIYSVAPNTVVATIPVGITPAGTAITADSRFAYVANNNNYGLVPGGYNVSVIDLTKNLVIQTIYDASFNEPYTVTINPAGTRAYVTNSNGTTVTIIDITNNTVIGVINGFDGPSGMVITPNGLFGYVNNYGGPIAGSGNGTTVSVVDLNTNTIVATLVVGLAPAALAITPNGQFIYVINYTTGNPGTGTISIINTSNNSVALNAITGFSGPFAIAINSLGTRAYVTNFGSNDFAPIGTTVSAVDLNTNSIIANINLAIQPAGVGVTPDSRFVYATNYNALYAKAGFLNLTPGQGTVNIIDALTNTVIPSAIAVGEGPRAVAISPNGEFAYISNYIYNSVSVIALQSFLINAQVTQIQDRFLNQIDLVNRISWTVSGPSLPISYSIYRDANLTDLAGTVLANQFVFLDHNRIPGIKYTYYIIGTNRVGTTSAPIVLTI